MTINQELDDLNTAVEKLGRGCEKAQLYEKMRSLAARNRDKGQSVQQSFAKIFTTDPTGRQIMQRYAALKGPGYFEPTAPSGR